MKQRPTFFRKFVESYVSSRRKIRLEPAQGSTPEATGAFEWYQTNVPGCQDYSSILPVDLLFGCKSFVNLKHKDPSAIEEIYDLVEDDKIPHSMDLRGFILFDNYLAANFGLRENMVRVRGIVLELAKQCGHDFNLEESVREIRCTTLSLEGFQFSKTGIVRV